MVIVLRVQMRPTIMIIIILRLVASFVLLGEKWHNNNNKQMNNWLFCVTKQLDFIYQMNDIE